MPQEPLGSVGVCSFYLWLLALLRCRVQGPSVLPLTLKPTSVSILLIKTNELSENSSEAFSLLGLRSFYVFDQVFLGNPPRDNVTLERVSDAVPWRSADLNAKLVNVGIEEARSRRLDSVGKLG